MYDFTRELWVRYRETGDPIARRELLEAHLGLVYHAANEIRRKAPDSLEFEDLVGAGTLGLVQAVEIFDPGRGHAFSTVAVPRIRGAILDELRSRDSMPRSARDLARKVARTRSRLEQEFGRAPGEHEMAAALGVDLPTWRRWEARVEAPVHVTLDGPATSGDSAPALCETLADTTSVDPALALSSAELRQGLKEALAALPERHRLVITLSYFENLSLKQIGEVLNVTESRVSQLRTAALRTLRDAIGLDRDSKEDAA